MNRIVAVTIVGVLTASPAFADCTAADRAALEEFDRTWGKATRSGDRATLEQVLADDYMGFGANPLNKTQQIASAVRNAEQARANQIPSDFREDYYQINCTQSSTTIVHRTVTTTRRGTEEQVAFGRSIHVVEKRNGRWQAVSTTSHPLNDQAILTFMEMEWNDAERNRDGEWFERHLAAEYAGTPASGGGVVFSKADQIKDVRGARRSYDSLQLSELAVRIVGDTALVTGINHIKGREAGGQAFDTRVRFTDTFVKRNGRWYALASQGTVIPHKPGT